MSDCKQLPQGTVDHKFSWQEIVERIRDNELAAFGRFHSGIEQYAQFGANIRKKYVSMSDYIYASVFGFPCKTREDGLLKAEVGPSCQAQTVFRANDFAYALEDSVSHHLVWCIGEEIASPEPSLASTSSSNPFHPSESGPVSVVSLEKRVQKAVDINLPGQEVVWFVNPVELQSIREIYHAHVFSRDRPPS